MTTTDQYKNPCFVCEGHVMFEGHERCPFHSMFMIYKPLIPLVTEQERQFSLQMREKFGYPIDEDELKESKK